MSEDKKTNFKKAYWPDITNTLEATNALDSAVKGFYVVAVIQACIGFFMGGPMSLMEPVIVASVAFWMKKSEARWTAVLLACWSLLVVYTTFENKIAGAKSGGGQNVILALIIVSVSITCIRATWFLNKNGSSDPTNKSDKPAA